MADTLTTASRQFYERSKAKEVVSITLAAASMMLLGFCSQSAGQSAAFNIDRKDQKGDAFDRAQALTAGHGFAAFVYIVGFVLLFTAAIMVSPVCCGTPNETTIMRNPQEIEEFDPARQFVAGGTAAPADPYAVKSMPV